MAIAFVQSNHASYGNSASARTCAYTSNVTAGSLLVVVISAYSAAGAVTMTLADTLGQTFASAVSLNFSNVTSFIYYFPNTAAGADTLTVTPSASSFLSIAVHEYSGVLTSSPVDGTNSAHSNSVSPSPGSVTAASGELIVAAYGQGDTTLVSSTVASPFTARETNLNGSTNEGFQTADDVNASGAETPTFTVNTAVNWVAVGASFKVGTPAGSDWLPFRKATAPPLPQASPLPSRLALSAALLAGMGGRDWIPLKRLQPLTPAAVVQTRQERVHLGWLFPGFRVVPGTGVRRAHFTRVPDIETPGGRQRHVTAHNEIQDCLNSLAAKGQLVQNGAGDWTINLLSGTAPGLTGRFSSGHHGTLSP